MLVMTPTVGRGRSGWFVVWSLDVFDSSKVSVRSKLFQIWFCENPRLLFLPWSFFLFCIFRLYKKMWQSSNLGWCMLVQHETVSASGHRLPMSKRFPIPIPSVGGVLRCCYTMFFHGFYSFVFQKFFVCFFPHPLDPSGRQWYWYFRGGDDTREPYAWGPWVLLPMRKSCRMPSKSSARRTAVLFFAVYSHV